jgi:uncharacterized protein (DUF2062 family)
MSLGGMMRNIPAATKRNALLWLSQGITPRRLALTLALGFAIGCIPVVGIPTVLCSALALTLRLNLPAIQAANYAAMPLQLALIVPFVRLGGWLVSADPARTMEPTALLHVSSLHFAVRMGILAGQALLAWLLIAVPVVVLLTAVLTRMLRRIPAIRATETSN